MIRTVTGRSSFGRRRSACSVACCIDDAQAVALATVDRSGVPTPSACHSIAKQSTASKRTMTATGQLVWGEQQRRRHRMFAWQMQEGIDRLAAGGQVDAPGNDSPFIGQTELKAESSLNDRRYQSVAEVPAGAARAQNWVQIFPPPRRYLRAAKLHYEFVVVLLCQRSGFELSASRKPTAIVSAPASSLQGRIP
jgi:hypothetical protein